MTNFYIFVGALLLLVILAPAVIHFAVTAVPLVVIAGLVIIAVRLVWFYTSRY